MWYTKFMIDKKNSLYRVAKEYMTGPQRGMKTTEILPKSFKVWRVYKPRGKSHFMVTSCTKIPQKKS